METTKPYGIVAGGCGGDLYAALPTYMSTQTVTAVCPGDSGTPVQATATAQSNVSQEDADNLAQSAAMALAQAHLICS